MRKLIQFSMATLLCVAPVAVLAGGPKGCPPGLARKNNGCLPPGHAKRILGRGDYLEGDYTLVRKPGRYGLEPGKTYYRLGDYVYQVDRDTKVVLDQIDAVAAILD